MTIYFSLEIGSRSSKTGKKSIFIRLTQHRKHCRISTGIQVEERFWDNLAKKVKKNHPMAASYNQILAAKLGGVTAMYARLIQEDPNISAEELVRHLAPDATANFFDFARTTRLAEIRSRQKMGTLRRYEVVLSKLEDFAGKNLKISAVNYKFLKEYSLYLKTKLRNTEDTISSNLSVIRSILNEAIRHGLFQNQNPFKQMRLRSSGRSKEKLTQEELIRVFKTTLPDVPSLILARDFFLACFLADGTRAGDMMLMKKENLVSNQLIFRQQKSGTPMTIPVVEPLQEIFSKYRSRGEYLFPFLNEVRQVNEQVINSKITYVNKYLREVRKYCGIFKKLTTHVARHTFTDLALKATGGNIYQVQQSLGHKSVKTTEIYGKNRVNVERTSTAAEVMRMLNGSRAAEAEGH